jgi:3'(2'), 5'-bisphosphate nucleotidase
MIKITDYNVLLDFVIAAAEEAGKGILEIYETADFGVEIKSDNSPLTLADKKSHEQIMEHLTITNIPVLSEEGAEIPYEERKQWTELWIVDPLDGTKEFIKRNGEFTVNIALVRNGLPVLGVIHVPVKGITYWGCEGLGSGKVENGVTMKLPLSSETAPYKVVGSRSHMSPETEQYVAELRNAHTQVEMVSMGSSLKICLVAEGVANEYPRFAPTMEWDTAAGHAIAKFAGKTFIDWTTQKEMTYNRENLTNNWFLVK